MADKDKDSGKDKSVPKPKEPPKPVQLGGESVVDRLLPHIKKIIIGAIVLAVAVMGFFQIRNCKQAGQERETEKLASVFELGDKGFAEPGKPPDPIKNPGFANTKERAEKLLAEIDAKGVDLGTAGPAMRASLLMDAGRTDEAIAAYQGCQAGQTIDATICREGLGIALETKAMAEKEPAARQKGLEDALAVFSRMQPADDGPRRAYAIYHQGRIQLLLGKKAEGKALLEKAKELSPPPDLSAEIERRLLSLGAA